MRNLPRLTTVAVVLIGLGWLAGTSGEEPPPQDDATPHAEQMARLAEKALQQWDQQFTAGLINPTDMTPVLWSERLVEARRLTGDREKLSAALQGHARRARQMLDRLREQQAAGTITPAALLSAEYNVAQAQYWLAKEGSE